MMTSKITYVICELKTDGVIRGGLAAWMGAGTQERLNVIEECGEEGRGEELKTATTIDSRQINKKRETESDERFFASDHFLFSAVRLFLFACKLNS
jgi:hypothetical protein